tara:strand:+ start:83 stop:1081 length:999 start_codon:yes stop_codon:yes gene_type:complete
MKIIPVQQRTPEWLDWRKGGVSASEIAIILGLSPYKTPWRLWMEKKGRVAAPDLSRNPNVRRGVELEDHARRLFEEDHDVLLMPVCAESDLYDIFRCSFDGVDDNGIPVELKVPAESTWDEVKEKGEEAQAFQLYRPQVMFQIFVAEADYGFLVFYRRNDDGTEEKVEFRIDRDENLISEIIEKGLQFWDSLVHDIEPEQDPERDHFYPIEDEVIAAWRDQAAIYRDNDSEIKKLESQVKAIKAKQKKAQDALLGIMGEFTQAEYEGLKISRFLVEGAVDWKTLIAEKLPDLVDDEINTYRKTSSERCKVTLQKVSSETPEVTGKAQTSKSA